MFIHKYIGVNVSNPYDPVTLEGIQAYLSSFPLMVSFCSGDVSGPGFERLDLFDSILL
jgi:hypothetical protein